MRARPFPLTFSLLMLALAACGSGEGPPATATPPAAATDPPTRTPTFTPEPPPPDFYDIDGNPVYAEPLPREAVDLMEEQVEAGEITLEEGVLGLMRLLAAEGDLPAYAEEGEGELTFDSVWGLTLMAYELYQESDDPELKAELERLLRKLAPPQEALDRYAMPAEEYQAGSAPGLMRSSELQISCDEVWHQGFPESAGPVPTCLLYDWFIAGGHEFRVYYPTDLANNPVAIARVKAALQALKDSQAFYSKLVEVRSINLVFSLVDATVVGGPATGVAMVPAFGPGELGSLPCPITVFAVGMIVEIPNFKQIVAHEVFHCIHLWRKGVSGYVDMKWYNEGMANYFSNGVYSKVNHEHKFVSEFHVESMDKSIFDMSYENTVFFQYLANRYGDPWLIELLDGMPSSKGAMVSYMAGLPEMEAVFQEFAQAYMETSIGDTGGGVLPGSPLYLPGKTVAYPGGGPLNLEAKPFHIERARIEFEEDKTYELTLELDGDPATERAKAQSGGGWAPMPPEVMACEQKAVFVSILTSTETGSISSTAATFDVEMAESEETQCDPCLFGVWERSMADDSYWDAVRQATAGMATELESVSGVHRLTFYQHGQYESQSIDFTLTWRGPSVAGPLGTQGAAVVTTTQRSAQGIFFTFEMQFLVMIEQTFQLNQKTEVIATGPISGLGGEERSEGGASPPVETPLERSYTCTPNTLSYYAEAEVLGGSGQLWTGDLVFDRVSSAPPP